MEGEKASSNTSVAGLAAVLQGEPDDSYYNNSNHVDYYNMDYQALSIAVPVVFCVIFVVGIIGNGCVISAVLRYKSMRNAPNIFIVNLAVGDILMILISFPTSAFLYTVDGWPYGPVMCKASYFIRTLSIGVSIFTLTTLSIDRVLVISQTMKIRMKTSTRITCMIASVWVLAIIVAIPDAISYHLIDVAYAETNETSIYCTPHPSAWVRDFSYDKIHVMAHVVIFFILPLIIIAVCYGIMAYIMVKSSHGIPGESPESSVWRKKQIETRKRIANIVIALIVLFFICWLPRSVFLLVTFYRENNIMTPVVASIKVVAFCLQFFNCCVNPIALYFLSKSFKSHYMRQFCCGRNLGRTSDTELVTRHSHVPAPEFQPMTRLNQSRKYQRAEQTDQTDASSVEQI